MALAWRTCEGAWEHDRYVDMAEALLRGELRHDRFHPFGYPLLVALVAWCTGLGALAAGCVVSAVAAGGMVAATGRLAETLCQGAGRPAMLLMATNGCLACLGVVATSDMLAAALLAIAIALATPVHQVPSVWRTMAIGALLGYAVGTRIPSMAVALTVLVWTVWRGGRWSTVVALAVGGLLGYAPNAVTSALATGSAVRNDYWHCIYLKVVCHYDYEQMQAAYDTNTFPTVGAFFREQGGEVLAQGAADLQLAMGKVLPAMLCGVADIEKVDLGIALAWWPTLLGIAGLCFASRPRLAGWFVAATGAMHVLPVCLTYAPEPRIVLPVLPVLTTGLAVALWRWTPGRRTRQVLLTLLAAMSLWRAQVVLREWLQQQPMHEITIAQQLPGRFDRPIALFATYGLIDRYVPFPAWRCLAAWLGDRQATFDGIRERMTKLGADVFLAGRISRANMFQHFATGDLPADFRRVYQDADVVVVELVHPGSDWLEAMTLRPATPVAGEPTDVEVRLGAGADQAQVVAVGVAVIEPGKPQQLLSCQLVTDRTYRGAWLPVAGKAVLQPVVLRRDGSVLRGIPSSHQVTQR